MMQPIFATTSAPRHSAGPALFLEIFEAGFIIREFLVELLESEAQMLGDVLFDFHNANSIAKGLLDVKGYLPTRFSVNGNLPPEKPLSDNPTN